MMMNMKKRRAEDETVNIKKLLTMFFMDRIQCCSILD